MVVYAVALVLVYVRGEVLVFVRFYDMVWRLFRCNGTRHRLNRDQAPSKNEAESLLLREKVFAKCHTWMANSAF